MNDEQFCFCMNAVYMEQLNEVSMVAEAWPQAINLVGQPKLVKFFLFLLQVMFPPIASSLHRQSAHAAFPVV